MSDLQAEVDWLDGIRWMLIEEREAWKASTLKLRVFVFTQAKVKCDRGTIGASCANGDAVVSTPGGNWPWHRDDKVEGWRPCLAEAEQRILRSQDG